MIQSLHSFLSGLRPRFRKISVIPLYPLLFTWYTILFFYSHNQSGITSAVLPWPMILSLLITAVVFGLMNLLYRNWHKAGIVTLIASLLFFLYSYFVSIIADVDFFLAGIVFTPKRIMLVLYILVVAGAGWWLYRTQRSMKRSTVFLNTLTLFLIALTLYSVVPVELGRASALRQSVNVPFQESVISMPSQPTLSYLPDIYYLIFDRYAGSRSLSDYYNFDNSYFTDALEDKGFYVADASHANYPRTIFSLSSSSNLNYLQELVMMEDESKSEATTLKWLLSHNAVGQILQKHGYTYYHLGNWYELTHEIQIANNILPSQSDFLHQDNFASKLLDTTLYPTIMHKYFPEMVPAEWNTQHRQWAEYHFKQFQIMPTYGSPKFVFGHMLMPHEPFVFDSQCQPLEVGVGAAFALPSDYSSQLACTNTMILEIVDSFFEQSERPPIIIVQSDEGPYAYVNETMPDHLTFEDASTDAILERNRILNAYYFPDGDYEDLYQEITPVNSFRTVLRQYFDMDLPNLPDYLYVFPNGNELFEFIDVTERVREAESRR